MIINKLIKIRFIIKTAPSLSKLADKVIGSMKQENQQQNQFRRYQYSHQIDSKVKIKGRNNFGTHKTLSFSSNNKQKDEIRKSENSTNNTSKTFMKESMFDQKDQIQYNQLCLSSKIKKQKQKVVQSFQQKAIKTLEQIKKWRNDNVAPVDVVGCERLHDSKQPIQIQKYQILIALMLSIQTKDETTGKIMGRLKAHGLTPSIISQMDENKLLELIKQTNFNKRKSKNIIQVSKTIEKFGLPKTKQQLMQFPGVGVKIATIYMRAAQGVNDGIGVDTHVHRISNRLGWVKNAKNPNETEQKLQQLFPKNYWDDINIALVGFGQILCEAKKPKCGDCPVRKTCPSSIFKF